MKTLFSTLVALAICLTANAQSVFVVQGENGSSAHLTLEAAVDSAHAGDYIYLPGGSFTIGNYTLNKQLNLIGAGHNPETTGATGRTYLAGSFIFSEKASNSSLQGVYLTGDISFVNNTTSYSDTLISNILISRCNISRLYYTKTNSSSTNIGVVNSLVRECIIRENIYGGYAKGHTVENSIISGDLSYINGNFQFKNCIFTKLSSGLTYSGSNIYFLNCIFAHTGSQIYTIFGYDSQYNTLEYCIFKGAITTDAYHVFYHCKEGVEFISNFVDVPDYPFNYDYDYHLNDTTTAVSAGANGTQCGIYGGENPFKEGGIPINPHILTKMIPSSTNSQGKLNIQVKVQAQEK